MRGKGFRSSTFCGPGIGVWGEVKGRRMRCLRARRCAAGAPQIFPPPCSGIIFHMLQGRKQRLREVKQLVQGHTARKQQIWDFSTCAPASSPCGSGPPTPLSGTADSTVPFCPPFPLHHYTSPSYWTLLLHFPTAIQGHLSSL